MVHLVLGATVLPLGDVGESGGGLFDQIVLDVEGGRVEHVLGDGVGFAGAKPLLEQVLVERVPEGTHRGVLLAPLARPGVQIVGVQGLKPTQ